MVGCGPGRGSKDYLELSATDQAKFDKYLILGKEIYGKNCATCHQPDGQGLRGVIPPLAQSDFLKDNQELIPCLLRFGTQDTIRVNGRHYPPQMPAHLISNLEMAEVLTYINNSWENEFGFYPVKKVDSLLLRCD